MKTIACLALLVAACQTAWGQCCCDHCGCNSTCQKVCRVICETKKVPKTTYDCECEDFCVPGPSCRTTCRDECGCRHHLYTPTCGKVRTRTKMIKHETLEEKPSYRFVVENVCCGCAQRLRTEDSGAANIAANAVPPTADPGAQPVSFEIPAANVTAEAPAENETPQFGLGRLLAPLMSRK